MINDESQQFSRYKSYFTKTLCRELSLFLNGYLLMVINIIFFLCCQLEISYSQFNLYNTEESLMMNGFDYHCLYLDRIEFYDSHRGIVPYCIRPETLKKSNDENKLCYGEIITFKELKLIDVSIADLFEWNAVIEIIELYEKYLLSPNLINNNEFYCKCSSLLQFGKSCEYILNYFDPEGGRRSLNQSFDYRSRSYNRPNEMKSDTCYIGISCRTNLFCLNWRQICNGIVDCDHGEDEPFELCLQMELNKCNAETEYRCKNGLCIPISFGYDKRAECPDESDRKGVEHPDFAIATYLLTKCPTYPYFGCDETNIGWKKFSCGDNQVMSYYDLTSRIAMDFKTCANNRHLKYLKKLFLSDNENECWRSMICLTGFDYLFSNIICLNELIEINIKQYCPNEFYFPSNSVIYSFVYFQYDTMNRTNWFNYTGPNYVCYNKEYCKKNILIPPTILKNNLTCFYVNQTLFSWKNFPEYIIYLFSSCYSNFSTSLIINDDLLYKCSLSNTFISIYRVKDFKKDCFFYEDEEDIDLCSLNTTDLFKCFTNENECIRQSFLNDGDNDCFDGSDEYIKDIEQYCEVYNCASFFKKTNLAQLYRFYQLCDKFVDHRLFSFGSNETDETDCEYWSIPCTYPECNAIWNCANGLHEVDCSRRSSSELIHKSFNCNSNEHYCIQLINNNNDVNMTCIHINRTDDDIIDCIGGTDERLTNICKEKYPSDDKRRFYCMNSSICISSVQVCDTINDCPFEDDERICPWLSTSSSFEFYCNNFRLHPIGLYEASEIYQHNCQFQEHLWFCDLALRNETARCVPKITFEEYPKNDQKIKSISFEIIDSNKLLLSKTGTLSLINTNDMWLCNEGYSIQSLVSSNKSFCLCPPSYYGDYCQYQSERLTFLLKIQYNYYGAPLIVFRLIIYLLDENNVTISHDEMLYNNERMSFWQPFFLYLMYERMTNISLYQRLKSKSVRIDSYIIKEMNVEYISSWLFYVSFPFLPVNRLVAELLFEDQSFKIAKCKKECGLHGKCMHYVNLDDTEYCWCDQGWFGEKCHLKSSSNLCNQTSCAPDSQCIILNDEKQQIKCICPLGRSGNPCYIKHNSCYNNLCKNNGTCLPLDQRIFRYVCICADDYAGDYCEDLKEFWSISVPASISDLSLIPAIVVIFSHSSTNTLLIQEQFIYQNVFLPYTFNISTIPFKEFSFIRMFHNISKSFYYMIAIQRSDILYLNTSVISSNLCKNVSEIFNETILYSYSYLKRLKLYHLPCQQNKDLRCFFDEYRMCLCTQDHVSDCYLFNQQYKQSNCDYCKNNGLCLRRGGTNKPRPDVICVCPKCISGSFCQFSTGNYFITLDLLIGNDTKNDSFNEQPFIIYLTLIILILILIISLIFNIISIIIFSNKKLRQVGCDLYLLVLTIISQIGLVSLFLRFLFTIIVQIYIIENDLFIRISCIFLEYSLRLIPSIFDWLTVCISIERTYTVIKDIHFTRLLAAKTLKLSRWIILGVFLLSILTTLHRPFYLILVDGPTTKHHPWCVLEFESTSWNIYEKFINIIHLVIPLILNLLSIILFLLRKTKSELATTLRKAEISKFVILKEQLVKYKPLLIGTMVIIILEIPRFILTFALICIEYRWQRYIYLTGYIISFLPLTGILFIYIVPSPKYNEQLQKIMKKTFRRSFFRNVGRN